LRDFAQQEKGFNRGSLLDRTSLLSFIDLRIAPFSSRCRESSVGGAYYDAEYRRASLPPRVFAGAASAALR
jgi:hypothetical protein